MELEDDPLEESKTSASPKKADVPQPADIPKTLLGSTALYTAYESLSSGMSHIMSSAVEYASPVTSGIGYAFSAAANFVSPVTRPVGNALAWAASPITSRLGPVVDSWNLIKPYWLSDQKWRALGLLGLCVGLTVAQVGIDVLLNGWRGDFYNALQNVDLPEFKKQIAIFTGLAALWITTAAYTTYCMNVLQMRWRGWLTEHFKDKWMGNKAFHRLQTIYNRADNPDQRISDDIKNFTRETLDLGLNGLNSAITLGSFVGILWGLSGPLNIPLGTAAAITIPGYMVWLALGYAGVSTWLTNKVGNKLVDLNYNQEKLEADFRFALVRDRENAENIAAYEGEKVEKGILTSKFNSVMTNFWDVIKTNKHVSFLTSGLSQAAVIFPVLMAAPRYFAGGMTLGTLMQVMSAFGSVQTATFWFVNSYPRLAEWAAATKRLNEFDQAIEKSNADYEENNRLALPAPLETDAQPAQVAPTDIASLPDSAFISDAPPAPAANDAVSNAAATSLPAVFTDSAAPVDTAPVNIDDKKPGAGGPAAPTPF